MSKSVNFSTVIPELNNAAIRRTPDGRASVYDMIKIVGQQKNPRDTWKALKSRYPEVVEKTDNFKFPGRGQKETPVTDKKGWAYILSLLSGVVGQNYRESAASLVLRYLDADITLAAEVVDRNNSEEDLEWLEARVRGKLVRRKFTGILKSRGVVGNGYAICTNKTYVGLFGTTAKGMCKRKGLSEKANWRDYADTSELVHIAFTEDLTGKKAVKQQAKGNNECATVCYLTAKSVFDFVSQSLA